LLKRQEVKWRGKLMKKMLNKSKPKYCWYEPLEAGRSLNLNYIDLNYIDNNYLVIEWS
jgi:hypothetical protein